MRSGAAILRLSGRGALDYVAEAGGHRWQRVPPGEKHDRVQSSSITVAVLPEVQQSEVVVRPEDVREKFIRGSGKGGQHRNKTSTAVVLKHAPSGQTIRVETERSQSANRAIALDVLKARLESSRTSQAVTQVNSARRVQVGSGERGDKVRTIQVRHDRVTQHTTGRCISLREYLKGGLRALWGQVR